MRDSGRPAVVARIRRILERRETPRLEMGIMALVTGGAGFLASSILLHLGLRSMPWRYVFALLFAYAVFFLLLRYWLHLHGNRMEAIDADDLGDLIDSLPGHVGIDPLGRGGEFGGGGASASFSGVDVPAAAPAKAGGGGIDVDLVDADAAAIPLVLVGAALALVLSSFWVIWAAPTLLAELLVDCALVGGLYRRLRRQEERDWERTALRYTILPFAATTALFALAGWLLQRAAPAARTLSEAMRILQEP